MNLQQSGNSPSCKSWPILLKKNSNLCEPIPPSFKANLKFQQTKLGDHNILFKPVVCRIQAVLWHYQVQHNWQLNSIAASFISCTSERHLKNMIMYKAADKSLTVFLRSITDEFETLKKQPHAEPNQCWVYHLNCQNKFCCLPTYQFSIPVEICNL